MSPIKNFFRGTAIYFLSTAIFFLLFALAYFIAFSQVTAKPEQVKKILDVSGAYDKAPAVIYGQMAKSETGKPSSVPLQFDIVRQSFLDAFTPAFVRNNVETAIDETYGWLQGKAGEPEFKIDLQDTKQRFADSLAKRVGKRLKKLPSCNLTQLPSNLNPYTAKCLPPGTKIAAVQAEIRKLAQNDAILSDTANIAPGDAKDQSGQPLFANVPELPKAYQTALRVPYFLALLAALLSAVVVYISRSKEQGLRKLAIIFILAGFFVILMPLGLKAIVDAFLHASSGDNASELAGPVLKGFNNAMARVYYIVGAVYIILGSGGFYLANLQAEKAEPAKGRPKK